MRVWLLKTVTGVGKAQTVVDVQPGYARNYLFPRGLGVTMNPALEAQVKAAQANHARQSAKHEAEQQRLHDVLKGRSVVIVAKANGERLFGSVTADQIVARLKEVHGIAVPASAVQLAHPLKTIGAHPVTLLFGTHSTPITVEIRANG